MGKSRKQREKPVLRRRRPAACRRQLAAAGGPTRPVPIAPIRRAADMREHSQRASGPPAASRPLAEQRKPDPPPPRAARCLRALPHHDGESDAGFRCCKRLRGTDAQRPLLLPPPAAACRRSCHACRPHATTHPCRAAASRSRPSCPLHSPCGQHTMQGRSSQFTQRQRRAARRHRRRRPPTATQRRRQRMPTRRSKVRLLRQCLLATGSAAACCRRLCKRGMPGSPHSTGARHAALAPAPRAQSSPALPRFPLQ